MTPTGVTGSRADDPVVTDVRRVAGEVHVTLDRVVPDIVFPGARVVHTGGRTRLKIKSAADRITVTHNSKVLYDGNVH